MTDSAAERAAVWESVRLVQEQAGYDFSDYQLPFLLRRFRRLADRLVLPGGVPEFAEALQTDTALSAQVVEELGLGVTEMFRDPQFFRTFRRLVIPELHSHPLVRVWVAGCATGEEAYSFAIMLEEAGFGDRYRIYATDINRRSLEQAKTGVIDATLMRQNTSNYLSAGGKKSLSHYYTARGGNALIRPYWRRRIVVAHHNLATDAKFNTFNVISCRNVLIYFNRNLHARVHSLLYDSLAVRGVLGLGSRESLSLSEHADRFLRLDQPARLYQRVG